MVVQLAFERKVRIQPVGSVHRIQDTEEAKADETRKGNKASTGSDYCKSEIFS